MRQVCRFAILFCAAFQLAACAGTSAIESQSKQRDARQARLYFLRPQGLIGALGGSAAGAEIKVDGKTVGTVSNGSYIFVDRPPGLHQLSAGTSLSMAFETEIQVEAGQAYYFNLGPPRGGAPGQDALTQAVAGGSGEQMRPLSPLTTGFSGIAFYSLDPTAGAAAIEHLKAP